MPKGLEFVAETCKDDGRWYYREETEEEGTHHGWFVDLADAVNIGILFQVDNDEDISESYSFLLC